MTDGGKKPDLHVVGDPKGSGENAAGTRWATRDEWLAHGRQLGERIERDRWALGDWAVHGDRTYGDLAVASVKIDVAYQTLRHMASVARKIELCRRRHNLSWSHHAEVASLPTDVGDALLDRAQAEGWTRAVMREEARAASRLGQLEAENERLRARLAGGGGNEPDETRRLRKRLRASHRLVRDEARRAVELVRELSGAGLHGNAKNGVVNAAIDGFRVLSADIRNARADAAGTVGSIANSAKAPAQAVVGVLMDDIDETLREITRRLDAADLKPEQARAVSEAFDARMAAIGKLVDNDVHCALDRKLAGEC